MMPEIADLQIKPGAMADFEIAFAEARAIIDGMGGYRSHRVLRGIMMYSRSNARLP